MQMPAAPVISVAAVRSADGFHFVTPNVSTDQPLVRGLLVSLWQAPANSSETSAGAPKALEALGPALQGPPRNAPVFFRISRELALLAPLWARPCCELKVSGGEELRLLWGSWAGGNAPPSAHPVVRFRGRHRQKEVAAQLVAGPGPGGLLNDEEDELDHIAAMAEEASATWHILALTPQWQQAEGHIMLEISWNWQQYTRLAQTLRFVEEESFFGDVAEVSEEHVPRDMPEVHRPIAEPPAGYGGAPGTGEDGQQEMVTIVDDHGGLPHVRGRGPDLNHVLLVDPNGDTFVLARGRDLSYLQEDIRLIHDLFLLTCTATLGGILAVRAGTTGVIGFLVGGAVAGPGGCDAIVELVQVESVAELGVCLLLFCLGLEFSFAELMENKAAAASGLIAMAGLCGVIVLLAAAFVQTPLREALSIGLFASLSSTPVSLRAINPARRASRQGAGEATVLVSVLVTQDMILACLLAMLPRVFEAMDPKEPHDTLRLPEARAQALEPWDWQFTVAVVGAQLAALLVLCLRRRLAVLLEAALAWVGAWLLALDDEFFALVALSYAFGLAYVTDCMGLSVELGAFAAGLSLASLSQEAAERAHQTLGGLKDVFAALFFGSIGLVVSGRFLLDNIGAILSVVMFVFILKTATAYVPLRLLATRGLPSPVLTAARVSFILAHVGEFGFVLAARGSSWGVLSRHVYLLLIGANSVSLCLTPWLFRALEWLLPMDEALLPVGSSVAPSAAASSPHGARRFGAGAPGSPAEWRRSSSGSPERMHARPRVHSPGKAADQAL